MVDEDDDSENLVDEFKGVFESLADDEEEFIENEDEDLELFRQSIEGEEG